MAANNTVPVGPTTKVGFGVTATAFAAALAAFIAGDRSEQTLGVLVSAAIGAIAMLLTLGGRYWQAANAAKCPKRQPPATLSMGQAPATGTSSVVTYGNTTPVSPTVYWDGTERRHSEPIPDYSKEVPGGSVPVTRGPE